MATNRTLRQRMTCDKCGEVHTNDNLLLEFTPGIFGDPHSQTCRFCEYGSEVATRNGTMGCLPGQKAPQVTREEDRLEAEETIKESEARS